MASKREQNLIPFGERSPEDARAIRSAGGKACQEKKKQQRAVADLLQIYSGLPVQDGRKRKRLIRMGIDPEDMSQKLLVVDAIMRGAQSGNSYLIQLYLDLIGEGNGGGTSKENNLLEALGVGTKEDIDTSEIHEILNPPESGDDVVEPPEL